MTTRRTRRSQEQTPEEQNIELEQAVEVEKQEETAPIPIEPESEPEPELSNDVVVARALEKAKEIEEKEVKKTGKIFLSDRDKKDFRKFNDYIMNKLGLRGTRSFKI